MTSVQASGTNRAPRWLPAVLRVLGVAALVSLTVALLHRTVPPPDAAGPPAGFGRGVLHGALMPTALPFLALGRDVPVYAVRNAGRPYNLGYTLGVNACGAVFFGFAYRRLARARRGAA